MTDILTLPSRAKHLGDVVAKHGVEIDIRSDGLVVWVNVDGICVSRILTNGFVPLVVSDNRKENNK